MQRETMRSSKLKFEHQRAISIAIACLFALLFTLKHHSLQLGSALGEEPLKPKSLANPTATFEMNYRSARLPTLIASTGSSPMRVPRVKAFAIINSSSPTPNAISSNSMNATESVSLPLASVIHSLRTSPPAARPSPRAIPCFAITLPHRV